MISDDISFFYASEGKKKKRTSSKRRWKLKSERSLARSPNVYCTELSHIPVWGNNVIKKKRKNDLSILIDLKKDWPKTRKEMIWLNQNFEA